MSTQGVEFESLNVSVPISGSRAPRQLLDDINLSLAPHTTTALLGRSGSGKTTLLRTVNALVRPTSGRVLVNNEDVAEADPIRLRRSIGYVIQETGLFPRMTIARNIGMALELEGRPRPEIAARAAEMLALVGLPADILPRHPWQLSGGQRQRVGLARALANRTLRPAHGRALRRPRPPHPRRNADHAPRPPHQASKTTLIITHDFEEALYLADRVILIDEGRIVADLPFNEVRTSANPRRPAYIAATHRAPAPPPSPQPARNPGQNWWEPR